MGWKSNLRDNPKATLFRHQENNNVYVSWGDLFWHGQLQFRMVSVKDAHSEWEIFQGATIEIFKMFR